MLMRSSDSDPSAKEENTQNKTKEVITLCGDGTRGVDAPRKSAGAETRKPRNGERGPRNTGMNVPHAAILDQEEDPIHNTIISKIPSPEDCKVNARPTAQTMRRTRG